MGKVKHHNPAHRFRRIEVVRKPAGSTENRIANNDVALRALLHAEGLDMRYRIEVPTPKRHRTASQLTESAFEDVDSFLIVGWFSMTIQMSSPPENTICQPGIFCQLDQKEPASRT